MASTTESIDGDDFKELPEMKEVDDSKFNVVHTGRFGQSDHSISPDGFFQAVRKMLQEGGDIVGRLRVHLAGILNHRELSSIRDLIDLGVVKYFDNII